jgi:hypothetical protein
MADKNRTDNTDALNLSTEILSKLKEISEQKNISPEQLILLLLDNFSKSYYHANKNEKNSTYKKESRFSPRDLTSRKIDIHTDLSKFFPTSNSELIELLRRIAQSIENIERSHEQGWSDQRKDLGAIAKKLDKLL